MWRKRRSNFPNPKNGPWIFEHDEQFYGAELIPGVQLFDQVFCRRDQGFEIGGFFFVFQFGNIENQRLRFGPSCETDASRNQTGAKVRDFHEANDYRRAAPIQESV